MPFSRRGFLTASGVALSSTLGCGRKRSTGFRGQALVANEGSPTIAFVNLESFRVDAQLAVEQPVTQLISHPSEPLIYGLAPKSGLIFEIDSKERKVSRKLQVGRLGAAQIQLSPDGKLLWALCPQDRLLIHVDTNEMKVQGRIALTPGASSLDLDGVFHRAVIAHEETGMISLIDLSTRTTRTAKIAERIGSVRFLSNGKSIVAANISARALTAVEASEGKVIAHLPLAVRPDRLCFNRDGGQLFITGQGQDVVVVVYPFFVPQIAETVLAGHAPGAMAASANLLFVASPQAGDVSILDIGRRKVVAVSSVGSEPSHISITPDDQYALILNRKSGDMAVIRTLAVVQDRRMSAALFTMVPVGSRPVSSVVKTSA